MPWISGPHGVPTAPRIEAIDPTIERKLSISLDVTSGSLTFDVRGRRSLRRREPQEQLADVPPDGIVMP